MIKIIYMFIFITAVSNIEASPGRAELNEDQKRAITPRYIEAETIAENEGTKIVTTAAGLNYRIAKDRKLEAFSGYEGMEEIDAYLYQKFEKLQKAMEKRFDELDAKLTNQFNRLESLLNEISEVKSKLKQESERLEAERKAREIPTVYRS